MQRDIESFTLSTTSGHSIGILRFVDNKNLGAIKIDTINYIYKTLVNWSKNNKVVFIVIESASDNFSSGGDLKELYQTISIDDDSAKDSVTYDFSKNFADNKDSNEQLKEFSSKESNEQLKEFSSKESSEALRFLKAQYDFMSWLRNYEKPVICFASGYCFGGGAALFLSCDIRISAPEISLAFPEVMIGNIPDCGAIYYLARSKPIGKFIALTSTRLNATNLSKNNLCDYIIPLSDKTRIISFLKKGLYSQHSQSNLISLVRQLDEFSKTVKVELPKSFSSEDIQLIKELDQKNDIESFKALLDSNYNKSELFKSANTNISNSSPTALFATQNLINKAEIISHEQSNAYEVKAVKWQLSNGDLKEGIRAKIIDKDNNPKWRSFDPNFGDITTIASIFT